VWPALNLSFLILLVPLMHRRILRAELGRWYKDDVLLPAAAALAVVLAARLLMPADLNRSVTFLYLAVTGFVSFAATVLTTPATRALVLARMKKLNENHA